MLQVSNDVPTCHCTFFFLGRGVGWTGFGVGVCCGLPGQRSPRTFKGQKNEYSKLKKTFFFALNNF